MKPNASIFVVLALFITACQPKESSRASDAAVGTDNLAVEIARGEYLVTAIGCNDCHTPKIFGPQGMSLDYDRLLSGHPASEDLASYDTLTTGSWVLMSSSLTAYVGPWGTSFASNLTPDGTGIGTWTEAQFAKAIREALLIIRRVDQIFAADDFAFTVGIFADAGGGIGRGPAAAKKVAAL